MKLMNRTVNKPRLVIMLILIALVVGAAAWWLATHDYEVSVSGRITGELTPEDAFVRPEETEQVLQNDIILPVGMLLTTEARAAYQDGTLRLVVPRLDLDCTVKDNTLLEDLEKGPGLYKYSQMPDIYNTNVCIAAHRDLAGCEFYYLDTVEAGDYIYLIYNNMVFQYAYRSTTIVESNDWDPIRTNTDCRATLTTCDPIGTSRNRMIVVGELVDYQEYSANYVFE